MTKHEQLFAEFRKEHPTRSAGHIFEGFTDYLIERLSKAEDERDELRAVLQDYRDYY